MSEPTETSPRKRRLLLVVAAAAAALAIGGGVVAIVVDGDGDGEPAGEEVGGDTAEDSTGPTDKESSILDSRNPVREARKEGIPVITITPKQAREDGDAPPKVQKLLEKRFGERLEENRK